MKGTKILLQLVIFAALALLTQTAQAANADTPNSFRLMAGGPSPVVGKYAVAAAQTWKGNASQCDLVALDAAGQVALATASSPSLLGCAAGTISAPAQGTTVYVYDDPDQIYEAQTSGTYAITMRSLVVDIEGTTGIQEINENASLKGVLVIVGEKPGTEIGANSRLYVKIARHQLTGLYPGTSGTADFGAVGIKADVIAESTTATGVTADGVLLKDNGIRLVDSGTLALGTGSDLSCAHDGTNTTCTSAVGDLIVDNTDVNDQTIFRLGTDTAATAIEFRNNTDTAFFKIQGSGDTVLGDNAGLAWGSASDYNCVHDGTLTTCTSATGDLLFDNTDVNDQIVFRSGTDNAATGVQFRNDSDVAFLDIFGSSSVRFADSATLYLGAGYDLGCTHDGTDTICTSATGDLVFDNTDVDDPTVIRLGTDTAATDFQVHNNSDATIFEVNGAGLTTVTGDLSVSGHVDGVVLLPSGGIFHAPAAEWGPNSDNAVNALGHVPQSQTAKTMLILFPLAVGDEIVSVNLAGFCTEGAALTLDARMVKITKTTGAVSVTGLECAADCFTQMTGPTGTWEEDEVLTAVYTTTATETYGLELTATTGAGDTVDTVAAWLTVNRKP